MSEFRRRLMMASQGGGTPMRKDYVKFDILSSGTVTFVFKTTTTSSNAESLSYSLDDGKTWVVWNNPADKTADKSWSLSVNSGDVILWKGSASCYNPNVFNVNNSSRFGGTATYNLSGNIMSLLSENFENMTTIPANDCFCGLFAGARIVSAYGLSFPATSLKTNCYRNMMSWCTYLTTAPAVFPAANGIYCLGSIFQGCTNLVNPPSLPADTTGSSCYISMFNGCTKLETAPILPYTGKIGQNAYRQMFYGAKKLNYVKALHTSYNSGGMFQWMQNVAATGIFVKNINATWTDSGVGGVPTGWTLIYYNPSTDKYYLSDKTTECDDHGNVINA